MYALKTLVLGSFIALSLTGCGGGKGIIDKVTFANSVQNNELYVGLDATMAAGGLVLPDVTLPLYNPKNPAQTLGIIHTNGLSIKVDVNASQALKLPNIVDGTKLPSGAPIPLILPSGLVPIAIPAINSNSLVYLAVNGNQIMIGVAVSILKEDRLKLPLNISLPFTINSEIRGTAGFFLGEKQGVHVFALRSPVAAPGPTVPGPTTKTLTLAGVQSVRADSAEASLIDVKSEPITSQKIRSLQSAWYSMEDVQLD